MARFLKCRQVLRIAKRHKFMDGNVDKKRSALFWESKSQYPKNTLKFRPYLESDKDRSCEEMLIPETKSEASSSKRKGMKKKGEKFSPFFGVVRKTKALVNFVRRQHKREFWLFRSA